MAEPSSTSTSSSSSSSSSYAVSHLRKLSNDFFSLASMNDNGPRAKRQKSGKSAMDIHVDQHFSSKSYTSGSTVSGCVVVNSPRDVPFDQLEIDFSGTAYTRVDFVSSFATFSARPFLKLRMPLRASDLPSGRVFQAGRVYTIPFHFVVPHQLTIGACSHAVQNPAVRDHHLRLPPSMGYWEDDDQAPEMAQIEYSVRARAFRETVPEGKTIPLEAEQFLKVLPSLPEDAPLDITAKDERYHLSKAKTIRKNLFSAKSGKITATATQPSAIMLSSDALHASESLLRVNLAFSPSSADAAPPKINSVSAKLHSTTLFSCAPMDMLPNLGPRVTNRTNPALTYSTTNPLTIAPIGKVAWSQEAARRGSGSSSSCADEEASESDDSEGRRKQKKSSKPSYKHFAALDIPFALPNVGTNKLFLPSFHSCLISRTYTIQLSISVGPMNTNVSLAVPMQVAVESPHVALSDDLPSFESAIAQAEEEDADLFLQPRLIQVPSARFQGTSVLPGYEDLARPVAVS